MIKMLGCFTCAVLHNARYPILLLKVKLTIPGQPGSCQISGAQLLRHVLLPTDFSGISARGGAERTAWRETLEVLGRLAPTHQKY